MRADGDEGPSSGAIASWVAGGRPVEAAVAGRQRAVAGHGGRCRDRLPGAARRDGGAHGYVKVAMVRPEPCRPLSEALGWNTPQKPLSLPSARMITWNGTGRVALQFSK